MNTSHPSDTKSCPFCAEAILKDAIKCKHCGEFLNQDAKKKTASERRAELNEMVRQGQLNRDDPEVEAAIRETIDDQKLEEQQRADEKPVTCPKCGSTQLSAQRKGFGLKKALIGGVLTGGIGLIAGFHGSRDILITCLKCGEKFYPQSPSTI